MRLRWSLIGALVLVTVLAGCRITPSQPSKPAVLDAACKGTLVASTQGTIAASAVTELSGLVASRRTEGVWWGHNDSGDTARIFAFGGNGNDFGSYALSGATAIDWEDIAAGPGPLADTAYLYVADIGDNARARSSVRVYRVPEPLVDPNAPTPAPQTVTGVATLTFTYPDGAHDAESIVVDPVSGALLIVTKEFSGTSKLFKAPANLATGSTTVLTPAGTVALGTGLAGLATGADVTPAGNVLAIRSYSTVKLFERRTGQTLESAISSTPCTVAGAAEAQGEAIGFTRDGRAYVTASEGAQPALHRFQAPS